MAAQKGTVRIGMGQMLVEPGRPDDNLARAADMIARAAEAGCQAVVLPEAMDTGWADESVDDLAEAIPGPRSRWLARRARRAGICVVAGLSERAGQRLHNSAVMLSRTGEILHVHRKINLLVDIEGLYSVGDRLGVVRTEFGTVAVNICADNFPSSLAQGHVLARR